MTTNDDKLCPVTGGHCPLDIERLEDRLKKLDQIHGFVFGYENQGGLSRRVDKLEVLITGRLDTIEKRVDELDGVKNRVIGWSSSVGALVAFAGTKLADWLMK